MKEYNKTCAICGKPYIAKRKASKCCGEKCKKERERQLQKQRDAKRAEAAAAYELEQKKTKSLAQVNREARERGMTYGKYVEWLYCEEERKRRKRKNG